MQKIKEINNTSITEQIASLRKVLNSLLDDKIQHSASGEEIAHLEKMQSLIKDNKITLESLVDDITEENRHEEVDFGPDVGKEVILDDITAVELFPITRMILPMATTTDEAVEILIEETEDLIKCHSDDASSYKTKYKKSSVNFLCRSIAAYSEIVYNFLTDQLWMADVVDIRLKKGVPTSECELKNLIGLYNCIPAPDELFDIDTFRDKILNKSLLLSRYGIDLDK